MQKLVFALTIACCLAGSTKAQMPVSKQFTRQLDSLASLLMEKVPVVPALSVTLVDKNGAVFTKAYGYADKEGNVKADVNTEFYIASSTKSFTGLAAALLDHEKKIMLDKPLSEYMNTAKFVNPVSKEVTMKTLLNHTSGLENSPLTFRLAYSGTGGDAELFRILSEGTRVRSQPGTYKYDNLGYNVYTLALQEYMHKNWQELLNEKIFTPLGMKRTTAYMSLAKKNNWTVASPYTAFGQNGLTRLAIQKQDNTMQSAGGLITTPSDIALWLEAQINYGKLKGKQVFPEPVIKATQEGSASFERGSGLFNAPGQYGMGWQVSTYKNEKVVYHFGGFPGYRSHISFMPEKKIGLAIFTNEGSIGGAFTDIISAFVYDWVAGEDVQAKYKNAVADLQNMYQREFDNVQKGYAERAKRTWQLSFPLQNYAGKYGNPFYGDIDISIENNVLAIKMGNLHAVSTPFTQKETVRVELIPGSGQVIGFQVNENGQVTGLKYDGIEFVRQWK